MEAKSEKTQKLLEMLDFYRGFVIDACEQECSRSPNWRLLRSRLLKIFGERGMQAKILMIMNESNRYDQK